MCIERIAPELPTKAPVTINKSFPNINPAADAAHPEYEFNIETTTGISPPPIAITNTTPMKDAIPVMINKGSMPSVPGALQNNIPKTTQAISNVIFII